MIENRSAQSLFPQPHDEDDGDVAWALQTAQVQWTRGLQRDALIWLRRAVESAIDHGAADRAAEINRAANHLSELIVEDVPQGATPLASLTPADRISSPDELLDAVDDDEVSQDEMEKHVRVSDLGEIGNALVALSSNVDSLRAQQRQSSQVPPSVGPPPPSGADDLPVDVTFESSSPVPASDSELPTLPPPPRKPARLGALAGQSGPGLPPTSARIAESLAETLEAEDFKAALTSEIPSQPGVDLYESLRPAKPSTGAPAAPPPPPSSRRRAEPSQRSSRGPSLLSSFPSRSQLDAEKAKRRISVPSTAPSSSPGQEETAVPALPESGRAAQKKGPKLRDKLTERDIELLDVQGFQDLPEDALDELTDKGRVEILNAGDDLSQFGVVLVLQGSINVMPAIADTECASAKPGEVVFTTGSLQDGVALRVVAIEEGTELAVWDSDVIDEKFAACPWVIDELMEVADRYQALAGVAMGPMGERLDNSLRQMVTDRCEVIALDPGELLVGQGKVVGGMHVVGVGRIELLKPDSDEVEDELGPGDFLFADQVLASGKAPRSARAGKGGAVVLFADRGAAHELLVMVPPLLEILAG